MKHNNTMPSLILSLTAAFALILISMANASAQRSVVSQATITVTCRVVSGFTMPSGGFDAIAEREDGNSADDFVGADQVEDQYFSGLSGFGESPSAIAERKSVSENSVDHRSGKTGFGPTPTFLNRIDPATNRSGLVVVFTAN